MDFNLSQEAGECFCFSVPMLHFGFDTECRNCSQLVCLIVSTV